MGNELLMFRAWDGYEEKYDKYIDWNVRSNGSVYFGNILTTINESFYIERCIGLRDCKQNPIFENDILRMSNVRNMPAIEVVVKWKRGAWWLEFDDASDDTMDSFVQEGAVFEVIGNIHERQKDENEND